MSEKDELILKYVNLKDIEGWTWYDVARLINDELGVAYDESTYRHRYKQLLQRKLEDADFETESGSDINVATKETQVEVRKSPTLTEFDLKRLEMEKERRKVQSEKVELNKWLRENARDELITEKICDAIRTLQPLEVPEKIELPKDEKEYILAFGDDHFGAEFIVKDPFGNVINEYSPEIFEKRMWELLGRVVDIVIKEEITELRVFSMGDFSDGILRVGQLAKLRYGVVDGTIAYSRFITQWLNELTKYVRVKYYQVSGNHTELRMLGQPKGTFKDQNMDLVLREFIKIRLENNPNFKFVENQTQNIFTTVATHNVMAIHGDGVKNMEKAIKDYSSMYEVPVNYLLAGHLHHSRSEEISKGQEVINIPSIVATDPYSESLRRTSDPAAKLLVFDRPCGLIAEYRLKLLS